LKFIGHLGKFDNLDHSGIMMIYLINESRW
jgi:hypothetical protein